jgi:hypothetical protein
MLIVTLYHSALLDVGWHVNYLIISLSRGSVLLADDDDCWYVIDDVEKCLLLVPVMVLMVLVPVLYDDTHRLQHCVLVVNHRCDDSDVVYRCLCLLCLAVALQTLVIHSCLLRSWCNLIVYDQHFIPLSTAMKWLVLYSSVPYCTGMCVYQAWVAQS